ncbi:ankyrin repeat-containing protein At5g02620-like isoform X1 [Hordeum vulgare subsp. vulgare]|uniref:ankyrin repeat-containing protein At5g02620-like isoform X1 n=1 Tax=Hordeum vulgare subsp. vulgare TaxID=112509 RepID=UPI000B47DD92|nr:ankyrin repeat-containing protein At5g02620-like isoform X1 [Hordeum vulgare subsp. vulgare]
MRAGGAEEESALRARNQTGATALHEAVRHRRAGVVDLLMTEAPHLSSVDGDDGVSPLYLAAATHSVQTVHALLRPSENGTPSPASFSGPEGRTALHIAATVSEVIVQAILSWQTQGPTLLAAVDSSGRTPLHFAALSRKFDIAKRLLDDHASLELASISDNNGSFPIHIPAMKGDTRTLCELIKRCPGYYELVDNQGRNLLHCAIKHGQDSVVRHICQNDKLAMLLNATDCEGNTPLHLAVECGNPRIVSLLLATLSVCMGITNKDGLTARDLCWIAIAPRQSNYFLDPYIIAADCLWWLRAPCTLEGRIRAEDKLATKNAAEKQHSMTKSGTIASVLIATVAFTAAFTVPGGFVADDHALAGTAILARHFAFRAFVVSDTMAFVCSVVATCFHIYGAAQTIPRSHRGWYNRLASGLVPVASQFMIAAFAFGFHLILGSANRWLIVLVYTLSLASLLSCFPSIWAPFHLGLGKAIWRRAGWRGLVNIHERPSSLRQLLPFFIRSFLFENVRRSLFVLLIAATFVVAIVLSIALPNY